MQGTDKLRKYRPLEICSFMHHFGENRESEKRNKNVSVFSLIYLGSFVLKNRIVTAVHQILLKRCLATI